MQYKNHFADVGKMVLYEVVMNEQEKSSNRLYYYAAVAIVVLGACYFLFGSGAGEGLYNYSDRADELGNRIEQGVQSNTKLQEQLRGAESTADEIAGSINAGTSAIADAEKTTGTIASDIETAADAIAKCQSIVNGIKQRNEGTKTKS